jgi:hypothetical protein
MKSNERKEFEKLLKGIMRQAIEEMQEERKWAQLLKYSKVRKMNVQYSGKNIDSSRIVFKSHTILKCIICRKMNINKCQYRQVMKLLQRLGLCEINVRGAHLSYDTFTKL